MALSLPSVPQELKPIASYLQRAEEVKAKDPVVAYWCKPLARTSTFLPLTPHTGAYYAAQVGIGLKAKEHTARTFLFDLLGVLETMKSDIGSSDAIEDEAVSCAYVENFALKVFAMADNEDRRGNATRYATINMLIFSLLTSAVRPKGDGQEISRRSQLPRGSLCLRPIFVLCRYYNYQRSREDSLCQMEGSRYCKGIPGRAQTYTRSTRRDDRAHTYSARGRRACCYINR